MMTRPSIIGHNKISRPLLPGQKIADIRNRLGEMRSYGAMRQRLGQLPGRILRPNLPGSLSITKIKKETKRSDNENSDSNPPTNKPESEDDTQILDSDDEEERKQRKSETSSEQNKSKRDNNEHSEDSKSSTSSEKQKQHPNSVDKMESELIVLTTDEKLPSEEALETKSSENSNDGSRYSRNNSMDTAPSMDNVARKVNLLKNYRHQRPGARPPTESSLSILERTTSVLNKESMPDFRKNLDDITQSYSPSSDEKSGSKSKKKKSPNKDSSESQSERQPMNSGMSHSVSSLLGSPGTAKSRGESVHNATPVAPLGQSPMGLPMPGMSHDSPMPHGQGKPQPLPLNMAPSPMMGSPGMPGDSTKPYPAAGPPPDAPYAQYPG